MHGRRTLALCFFVVAVLGPLASALAQHHRGHRHGHTQAAPTSGAAPDAGTAAGPTAANADAGAGAAGGPTRNGGGPTRGSGSCSPSVHIARGGSRADGARSCERDSDCTLARATCCQPCGMPDEDDVVAVASNAESQWSASLCQGEDRCHACASQPNPSFSATCLDGRCEVRVRTSCDP